MKKVIEFKKFLDENVDEIKKFLVDDGWDEDDLNGIVSFEDDEYGGFVGCDEDGWSCNGGCNIYEREKDLKYISDDEEEDLSMKMGLINGKEVYFLFYDF